jgi:hypothetical protein
MEIKGPIWLSNGSWLALALVQFLLYGGIHPDRLTVNFAYFYVGFLMILLNVPLFIALLIKGIREKQVLFYETMHLIVKIAIAFYLIEKSGI